MDNIKKLKEYIISKSLIDIHRNIGFSPITCVPLAIGKEILLIQCLKDFHLEGYQVIRIKDISKFDRRDTTKFVENILKKEGIYEHIKMPNIKMQDTIINMLREIQKKGVNFILDCDEIDDGIMYMGKIMKISDRLLFKTIDTLGRWDEDLLEVNYDDITSMRYEEYNIIYSKHLT